VFFPVWAQAKPESEAETIGKCLQALQSPDSDIRRAAALVIGKYDTPEAQAALLRCLHDQDAGIRQSALVSLTEESRALSVEVSLAILRLLSDEDVHIRRISSSLLDNVAMGQGTGLRFVVVDGRIVRQASSSAIDEKVLGTALNQALADADSSVRRNILLNARYFPGVLQSESLLPFLSNASPEIVVLALQALASAQPDTSGLWPEIQPLLQHPQTAVRLELLNYLSQLAEDGLQGLEILADDQSPAVRLGALRQLANTGSDNFFKKLQQALLDESLPAELRLPLLNSLRNYGDAGRPVFQAVLTSKSPSLRAAAMRHLSQQPAGMLPMSIFLGGIRDSQREVRSYASIALQRQQKALSESQIRELLHNPYPEIRSLALRLAGKRSLALEFANEALLDEDIEVRKSALQIIAAQRSDAWLEILMLSLEDENPDIRDYAATLLQTQTRNPQVAQALQKYLPLCQNEALRMRLQQLLNPAVNTPRNVPRSTIIPRRQ